jgi:hypothetical protein
VTGGRLVVFSPYSFVYIWYGGLVWYMYNVYLNMQISISVDSIFVSFYISLFSHSFYNSISQYTVRGGRDCMVVGFITTYAVPS